jgi:hypothetical protein
LIPSHARPSRKAFVALAGVLLVTACSGGQEKPILAPTIRASLLYTPPNQDRTVFFTNTSTVGDAIQMDVVVQDSLGTLDTSDIDLVLRYDATFIQVVNIGGQNTLFGTCNTVNPVCGVISPNCLDNRAQANGGGPRFCRSDLTIPPTSCTTDKDCAASGDACGSFGTLLASFAVLVGPTTCSSNSHVTCSVNSDCDFCVLNKTIPCAGNLDCSGTCGPGNTCSNIPGRICSVNNDCQDTCDLTATCRGCPPVVVSGVKKIASLTLRVMKAGSSDFLFVVPSVPGGPGSAVRHWVGNVLVDQAVEFFPKEGADIRITGSL